MKIHKLKILPKFFNAITAQDKHFEIRKDDRDYKVGDILCLREWEDGKYTGYDIFMKVIYILRHEDFEGVAEGYCVMSIEPCKITEEEEERNKTMKETNMTFTEDFLIWNAAHPAKQKPMTNFEKWVTPDNVAQIFIGGCDECPVGSDYCDGSCCKESFIEWATAPAEEVKE